MLRWIALGVTHAGALAVGFALGVYLLPILTAPKGPDEAAIASASAGAVFSATFTRDLEGSDFLHWGEGEVMITAENIVHKGALSPGPDYKVYLAPSFVETEEAFLAIKDSSRRIGDVKTFDGFIAPLPDGVDPADYTTIVIWCEAFSEFITAAKYR